MTNGYIGLMLPVETTPAWMHGTDYLPHITMNYLGQVTDEEVNQYKDLCRPLRTWYQVNVLGARSFGQGVALVIARPQRSKIVWLREKLDATAIGAATDQTFPTFEPHITLPEGAEIDWDWVAARPKLLMYGPYLITSKGRVHV